MTRIDVLLAEFTHETDTTRRHLARLPTAEFDWRPHAKSFTAGQLASHLIDCIRWVQPIFGADQLDMDPSEYAPCMVSSSEQLLETFDRDVANAKRVMGRCADTHVTQPWRLIVRGAMWFEKPREAVFRDMSLSHLVHHRGQCSVYLRLLDIPVPESYGPTADDDDQHG